MYQAYLKSVKHEDEGPADVLIKYLVPPPVQEEFIEIFMSVKDGKQLKVLRQAVSRTL